jgi:hypothetical protein
LLNNLVAILERKGPQHFAEVELLNRSFIADLRFIALEYERLKNFIWMDKPSFLLISMV